ncbi:CD44 antigen isoform X27 [Myotis myotis]|uniref:CD44 antigen isoform X27 n=1 Tax=Myotis myotis TaxID=51298 RepID=UPI00174A5D60|nr:CD44 antigen isoform X27 [Myotis myotis]
MNKFGWCAAWGLCLLQLSLAQIGKIDLNVTCRYAGVFHVEKNGRYSISRTEAADLCKAFDCTLPTMAQMEKAWQAGFETCRYGFIEGHVVIPRIHPNPICAANNTGVYILTSNTSQYDTYCYNASAPQGEDCTAITNLTNAFDGEVSISIVNRDGTRYTQKGEYRTNPDDINNTTADYDTSSGSYGERSTPESYIIHTHFPTAHPTQDQDSPGVSYYPEETPDTTATALMSTSGTTPKTTTKRREAEDWFSWLFQPSESKNHLHTTTVMAGTDSNTISAGWKPTEENEDERDKHPIHSGSGIDDDEDFISSTISATPQASDHSTQNRNGSQWSPGFLNPEVSLQTTTRMTVYINIITTDVDRSGTSDYGENWTQEAQSPLTHHEHHDEAATQHSTSTKQSHTQSFSTSHGGLEEDKGQPMTSTPTSSKDGDSSSDRSDHTTQRSGPTGHSSGSQEGDANTTSGPIRKPQIPEWLIILASLLALALILAVCIAVNSRRRCGQKKKLVINGNGAVEDRKPSGLNGEASKSQEMVHLVNKESSETPDQCMTADETRNLQNVDMKIGV